MNETDYRSPLEEWAAEWEKLSPSEKALCVSYRRALLTKTTVPSKLVLAVNEVHIKHPDFHIGCMPREIA